MNMVRCSVVDDNVSLIVLLVSSMEGWKVINDDKKLCAMYVV